MNDKNCNSKRQQPSRLRISDYLRCEVPADADLREVNEIWKLIIRIFEIPDEDVRIALIEAGVSVSRNRIKSWRAGPGSEHYSPMNYGELRRTLSALLEHDRRARRADHSTDQSTVQASDHD